MTDSDERWTREEMLNMLEAILRDRKEINEQLQFSMTKSLCYYLSFNGEVPIDFL